MDFWTSGQMTRVADTAAVVTKTFAWDHLGRMTHAEVNNGGVTKSVDYANNPAGKRFMRVAGGVTKAWTYQGDNIASVESTTSPTLHSVYSGSGLGGVVERDDVDTAGGGSTTSRFYLYNHRGDVVGVSDASGDLTSAYAYDAYGSVSQSAQSGGGSAPTDDILFTGKDLDPDTGLYYFNARWYDSESGRFVSRTGLQPDAEEPYAFCADDPVSLADPNGWYAFPIHMAFALIQDIPELIPRPHHWVPRVDRFLIDPFTSAYADFYPSIHDAQDPDNANRHGMEKPGQCRTDAIQGTRDFIAQNIDHDYMPRGQALHASHDPHALAHDYDEWNGKLDWTFWFSHFPSDWLPFYNYGSRD